MIHSFLLAAYQKNFWSLTYEPMFSNLDETIKSANRDGVEYFLTISTEDKSYRSILNILENIIVFLEHMVFTSRSKKTQKC